MQKIIYDKLNTVEEFRGRDESYSPLFSSIGLSVTKNGIDELYFNYNRFCRAVFDKVSDFSLPLNKEKSDISLLYFGDKGKSVQLAFYGNDRFVIECSGINELKLFPVASELTTGVRTEITNKNYIYIKGFSTNGDDRDPDRSVNFTIGIRVICGSTDGNKFTADNDKIILSVAFVAGSTDDDYLNETLEKSPDSAFSAAEKCREWFKKYTDNFSVEAEDETAAEMLASAVKGLLFNTTAAQGNLSKHLSPFPSRGGYPCAFLWDTYFQNFGYKELSVDLCKDFLLQIADNRRSDGKFPQFMCSTWGRPHDSQPALYGWAVMNAVGDDLEFAGKILPAIESNNQWWLTARMTKYGLISCPSGLETGQDDSPRFDNGPTVATDMNACLLSQLKAASELSDMLGLKEKSGYWRTKAEILSENIMKHLYCEEDNLFYDIDPDTGNKIRLVSIASLYPLWAGVNISKEKASAMIEKYLINPEYMFGKIPFPSVAYNQDVYETDGWWRGPTWMPTSWLMLETLEKYGYTKERRIAVERLYRMIKNDKHLHELFNSATGEGIGHEQQGWTCGLFIQLAKEISENAKYF